MAVSWRLRLASYVVRVSFIEDPRETRHWPGVSGGRGRQVECVAETPDRGRAARWGREQGAGLFLTLPTGVEWKVH